jgi:hypothetical protein
MPVAADSASKSEPTVAAQSQPQKLPPPPVVPDSAYASVAQAMAEVEVATHSGRAEDQQKLVRVEQWLGMQGAKIEPELAAVIKDPAAGLASRVTACRVLARLGPRATPTLLEAAATGTKQVRVKAIESLGRIKPPSEEISLKLVALLDDPDVGARRAALLALSHIGPPAKTAAPSLVQKLTGILNDPKADDTLRTAAHSALKKIEPRTTLAE